jgi:hypothetical protein
MPSTPNPPEVVGPRKRKLSTKAAANGDFEVEQKRKKLESVRKKNARMAPTKKNPSATAPPKKTTTTAKQVSTKTAAPKTVRRYPSAEVEDVDDDSDHHISVPPRNPRHILEATDGSDDDIEEDEEEPEESAEEPEESAEAELSTGFGHVSETVLITNQIERLSKDWTSPIYVFFKTAPRIEYTSGRRLHVFECAAGRCRGKNGRDVRRYLDTGDAKSTSSLRRHAKKCWGDEAIEAADGTQDLEGARVVLAKTKLCNGSITAEFERIGKEKVTYSHRQHTSTEAR